MSNLWNGLSEDARAQLETRSYARAPLAERLGTSGVDAREIASPEGAPDGLDGVWIPGVIVFPRTVYPQHCRGFFGEFARATEGPLHRIGLWPRQWAAARMFAGSAKGFHIHPPHIPEGTAPDAWFRQLYGAAPFPCEDRPYDREQWDVMFFLQGIAEMILVDERPGLERRVMRFIIWGDDLPSPGNAGVVIPAGVAHAIRSASSSDLLMVYGTSTTFVPASEGRIASSVELAPLPGPWQDYLDRR